MMRRRLLGVFNSIDDAKHTLGQIKKESWNQTEFMVIIGEPGDRGHEMKTHYEMAEENFLSTDKSETGRRNHRLPWPGLQEMELAGIGAVNVGFSIPPEGPNQVAVDKIFSETDKKFVKREISSQRVVAFIETEEQFLPKLRLIMETNGAELVESGSMP